MIRYIYKVKEKINIHFDEQGNEIFDLINIFPLFLCSIPVKDSDLRSFTQENGEEITIAEINMKTYYPFWDKDTMVMIDYYVKYPIMDNGLIRAKDNYELYLDGIYTLKDGEFIEDKQIKYIENPYMFGNWNGISWIEDLDKKMEYYIQTIKGLREPLLLAYDKLAVNRANGVDNISDEDWEDVLLWRSVWLNLTENIDLNKTIEEQIPPTLNIIKYYL